MGILLSIKDGDLSGFWYRDSKGYLYQTLHKKRVWLHRLVADRIWREEHPDDILDYRVRVRHLNGVLSDCRRENLLVYRYVDHVPRGKRRQCSSKYMGVYWWEARGKWHPKLYYRKDGKRIVKHLGLYDDEREAALARDNEARRLLDHPLLNFPDHQEKLLV